MKAEELLRKYAEGKRAFPNINLYNANFYKANLYNINLYNANLNNAHLDSANLSNADLSNANLVKANLSKANLSNANLPSPTMVLLAEWDEVSNELCRDLMRFDTFNHPYPAFFEDWATAGNPCPFKNVKVERSANFTEKKELWEPGPAHSAFYLMTRLIREKCRDSDYHQK